MTLLDDRTGVLPDQQLFAARESTASPDAPPVEQRQPAASHSATRTLRWSFAVAVGITTVIAAASFVLSFATLWDLATMAGLPRQLSWLWPVIVDGTILQATISVIALASHGGERSARKYFWAVLGVAALVSIASNALHAFLGGGSQLHPALAAAIATVAPVSLLAATHGLAVLSRARTVPAIRAAAVSADVEAATHRTHQVSTRTVLETEVAGSLHSSATVGEWPDWDAVAYEMCNRALTSRTHSEVVEILRGKFQLDRSNREIGKQVDLHHSTVGKVIDAARPILDHQAHGADNQRVPGAQSNPSSDRLATA